MTPPQPIIERIQKLMRLSSSSNEHEASLAGERMQELMQQWNLTRSDVEGTETSVSDDPLKAQREKKQHDASALYAYQQDLMRTIARNNFCLYMVGTQRIFTATGRFKQWNSETQEYVRYKRVKCHTLIGRSENVTAAMLMYDYLIDMMNRLMLYSGAERRSSDARMWLAGCAERLCERLAKQRTGAEHNRNLEAKGTPGLIRLTDLYGSEEDLNEDFRRGCEPGTTARNRLEDEAENRRIEEATEKLKAEGHCWEEAYYLARGWRVPENVPRKVERETPEQEQERKREQAKRDKKHLSSRGRSSGGWTQKDQREWDRKHSSAFAAGRRSGDNVGLGGSLGTGKKGLIDA